MIIKSRKAAARAANPFRALIARIAWMMWLFPLLVLAVPAQSQTCTTISSSWYNSSFAAQTGTFTATILATPSGSPINNVIGLSDGSQNAYSHVAAIARFNPSGNIDAYNGGSTAAYQAASTIPYTAGTSYLFEYDVNVAAQTYTVYVTPGGGTKTLVGQNFAFRLAASTLNNLASYAEVGSDSICNLALSSGTSDFDLTLSPASQTLVAGSSTTYTATATPVNGFSGTVALKVTGLPADAIGSFSPASISGGSGTSTLTVQTSSSTPAGSSTVTVSGASGSLTHSATASLGVTAVGSCNTISNTWFNSPFAAQTSTFTAMVAATPSGNPINNVIGLSDGSQSAYSKVAAIARFNPSGDIDAYDGGSTAAYQAASTIPYTAGSSYLFEYDVNVANQTYTVYVTPSGGAKTLVGENFAFRLAASTLNNLASYAAVGSDSLCNFGLSGQTSSFALSASPTSQSVAAGGAGTYTVSVTPSNGFANTVTLSASGLPSGATATFGPTAISGGSGTSTLTLTTSTSTPSGSYPITISGTDGTLTSTARISLVVSSGSTGCAHGNGPLDPSQPPGCNFDLSAWHLQLPIGSTGNPTTISNPQLETFTDAYFFTGPDGAMDFDDPGVNCVTTANSTHCRSELGEVNSWSPTGTNTLSAKLKVTNPAGEPVIGQIHLAPSISVRPIMEVYYNYKGTGHLEVGVEQCTTGGCQGTPVDLGPDPTGVFSYVISYSNGGQLTISINGGTPVLLSSPILGDAGYFKAGDYGQAATDAAVSFYSLKIVHSP
jgi:hypothetical protein